MTYSAPSGMTSIPGWTNSAYVIKTAPLTSDSTIGAITTWTSKLSKNNYQLAQFTFYMKNYNYILTRLSAVGGVVQWLQIRPDGRSKVIASGAQYIVNASPTGQYILVAQKIAGDFTTAGAFLLTVQKSCDLSNVASITIDSSWIGMEQPQWTGINSLRVNEFVVLIFHSLLIIFH